MKLYNIVEPKLPELAIGIDLGTTNSLIAVKHKGKKAVVIKDNNGNSLTPSAVRYTTAGVVVGHAAIGFADSIVSIKRMIGKNINDLSHHLYLDDNDRAMSGRPNTHSQSSIEITAVILKTLKEYAEHATKQKIKQAVITVPAFFNDDSRNATIAAAKLADIEVLRLINEPTAAALYYNLQRQEAGLYLVYDLGGGTFDVSILSKSTGVLKVIATAGDLELGGDNFDLAFLEYIHQRHGIHTPINTILLNQARVIREHLSEETSWYGLYQSHTITVTRKELDDAVFHLVKKTENILHKILIEANINKTQISEIVLVGGLTRTPAIKQMLQTFFGKRPLDEVNPDEIVALGAATQAYSLLYGYDHEDSLLLDVTPLTLGIELFGGILEEIIPRNTPIPSVVKKIFTNYSDKQTSILINVIQGESDKVNECRSLGKIELKINQMPVGTARIEVAFLIDADGVLTVKAQEENTGYEKELTLHPSHDLDMERILKLLQQHDKN